MWREGQLSLGIVFNYQSETESRRVDFPLASVLRLDGRQVIFFHRRSNHIAVRRQRFNTDTSRFFVNGHWSNRVRQTIVRTVAKQTVNVVLRQDKADVVTEVDLTVRTGEIIVTAIIGDEIVVGKGVPKCLLCPARTTQARKVVAARDVTEFASELGTAQVEQRSSVVRRRLGGFLRLGLASRFGGIASAIVIVRGYTRMMMNGQRLHHGVVDVHVAITVAERFAECHGTAVIVLITGRDVQIIQVRIVQQDDTVVILLFALSAWTFSHESTLRRRRRRRHFVSDGRFASVDTSRRRQDDNGDQDGSEGARQQHDDDGFR